jgi:hypothetical protein
VLFTGLKTKTQVLMPLNKVKKFKLIMVSAMYENGGNTCHRFIDGHPEIFTYPFESQTGTHYVDDHLNSLFPFKYRWPVFPLGIDAASAYELIRDEECKVRIKTPEVSKFRHFDLAMNDQERKDIFCNMLENLPLSVKNIVSAFFMSTFMAWKNLNESGEEHVWAGYNPVIVIDFEKIIRDFGENCHMIHVVRNPFSAYSETKKRPLPLSLDHYITAWILTQYYALLFKNKYPEQLSILRYEDMIQKPGKELAEILAKTGLKNSDTLQTPSWNKNILKEVYPWGTIRIPASDINIETAKELETHEIKEIFLRTKLYLEVFSYMQFYNSMI